ncbi:AlbA family DNA-binding domain-containing protein [Hymenobacter cavernae]|uniref:Schlafen AlbA-2 domain-containing protein n=1 Tax=Hymenobacter cavernae TaxID=2044852 RepID=A0ABQ1UQ15_9BACT|nr:ATP-binding protein [Hymenobacter cavernae]GGF23381.1 hypothetical protein GCM10011383_38760 [Hymenobacter cavernae]
MEYSQIYFGKPLGQLTYPDLEAFFSVEREESDQLEFKSCNPNGKLDDKIEGVTQGICAFLNSSGGLLIWGAPEGKKVDGKKEKVFVGDLTRVPLTVEKDWLISKISDKIIPLPIGIRAQLIRKDDYQVCVFEIDESPYAPHQTDNIYYMRIDGQKKPAPHHYIEALFKKVTYPRLEAYIIPEDMDTIEKGCYLELEFFFFNFSPFINEEGFYYKIQILGGVFADYNPHQVVHPKYTLQGSQYTYRNEGKILYNGEPISIDKKINFTSSQRHVLKDKNTGEILVFFGGKTSPIKVSRYKIDLSGDLDNVRERVSIVYENKLISEIQTEINDSENDMLEKFGILRKKVH